jgi:hypothetical protein
LTNCSVPERQSFLVGDDGRRAVVGARFGDGRRGDDPADRTGVQHRAPHRVGGRAEIDRHIERPPHRREPLRHVLGHAIDEERDRPERRGAAPPLREQRAVKQSLDLRHRSALWRGGSAPSKRH